jgi:hypothetical protein
MMLIIDIIEAAIPSDVVDLNRRFQLPRCHGAVHFSLLAAAVFFQGIEASCQVRCPANVGSVVFV